MKEAFTDGSGVSIGKLMDTLFRFVSYLDHQQQQTVTRSSSSSRRNTSEEEEECCNVISQNNIIYMDEDDFSAGTSSTTGGGGGGGSGGGGGGNGSGGFGCPERFGEVDLSGGRWATDVLVECATALAGRDTGRVQELMWVLNEVASPYGDTEQKLACYFMQGLFSRMTLSGNRCRETLTSAFDKATSFDSTRRTGLRFMEASPWMSFGHVAANGAILEAFESEQRLHIIDVSNTFCTQWPTLLEALATRSSDETPYLRLTTVVASPVVMLDVDQPSSTSSSVQRVMKEIGMRMEKFARLMGVPFKFQYVHHAGDISGFDFERCIDINSDEALAINCVNSMHGVPTSGGRNAVAEAFRRMKPKLLTIVEEEADIIDDRNNNEGEKFLRSFKESLRFFKAYFESLDESFPKTSNERLALERAAGRAILDLVACEPGESGERRETGSSWSNRMRTVGFESVGLSDDATDDVRALLRRYREGWSLVPSADVDKSAAGIFLAWKDQPVVWSCAWKP